MDSDLWPCHDNSGNTPICGDIPKMLYMWPSTQFVMDDSMAAGSTRHGKPYSEHLATWETIFQHFIPDVLLRMDFSLTVQAAAHCSVLQKKCGMFFVPGGQGGGRAREIICVCVCLTVGVYSCEFVCVCMCVSTSWKLLEKLPQKRNANQYVFQRIVVGSFRFLKLLFDTLQKHPKLLQTSVYYCKGALDSHQQSARIVHACLAAHMDDIFLITGWQAGKD